MKQQFRLSGTVITCAIVGFFLANILGLFIGGFIGYILDRRNTTSKQNTGEILQRQVTYMAQIIGVLLRETKRTSASDLSNAKRLFIQEITYNYNGVDVHTAAEEIEKVALDADFPAGQALANLRNTVIYSFSKTGATIVVSIAGIYIAATRWDGTPDIKPLIMQIAMGLGLNAAIADVLFEVNFSRYRASSQGYQSSYGYGGYGGGYSYNDSNNSYSSQQRSSQKELQDAFALLGVNEDVTQNELNRAKKRLLAKWHPDKAPSQDKLAEYTAMSQKINSAADIIAAYKRF